LAFLPQSNQRGIETELWAVSTLTGTMPQSNQRGIETTQTHQPNRRNKAPQSNQRGIETPVGVDRHLGQDPASIEPAWD